MGTVGYSTTPTFGNFGFGLNVDNQIGSLFTMPSPGGQLTVLHAYAATFTGGSATPILCVWNSSGTLLASVSATAAVAQTTPSWVSGTLATPLFVAGGTQIYIGWANPTANGFLAEYDNNGGSISYNEKTSPPRALSGGGTHTGVIGAYADYTPGLIFVRRSGGWTAAPQLEARRSNAWVNATAVYVRRSGAWVQVQ